MKRAASALAVVNQGVKIIGQQAKKGAGQIGGPGAIYAFERKAAWDRMEAAKANRQANRLGGRLGIPQTPKGALGDLTNFISLINSPDGTQGDVSESSSPRGPKRNSTTAGAATKPAANQDAKKKPELILPDPEDGSSEYSYLEAARLLAAATNFRQTASLMIQRGLVPVALTRCHNLKKQYKSGQRVFPSFGEYGRARTMGVEPFDSMVEDQVETGNSLGLAEVKAILLAHKREVNTANGMSNSGVSISGKTGERYKAAAAMNEKMKVTVAAIDKTDARYIA
jgi:hypothetical protein